MKKILGVCAFLALVIGGACIAYQKYYGGETYYVKMTTDGQAKTESDDKGNQYTRYWYDLTSVNAKLKKKRVVFSADHQLKRDAYLALTVNDQKGVTTYKEVKTSEIKPNILKEIK